MTAPLKLTVPAPGSGERLDRFLAAAQTDLSRSRLQTLIRQGLVSVNGRPARASQRLRGGDAIEVALPPLSEPTRLEPEPLPLSIVFEDEHLMVIDKPAGLIVHPGAGANSGTLVHALLHHVPAIRSVGGADRPGIVHRLDKDTSGLLVVAKTARVHRELVEMLRRRAVRRVYLALVWGEPHADSGEVEAPLGRDPRQRKRMAVVARGGRPAHTRWRVVERLGVASLLEVRLETGRTHQIRVHLAHLRHPVVGDPTYGGRPKKQLSASERERSLAIELLRCLPRQALHAVELAFTHPVTGEKRTFTSPMPEDLRLALARLREHVRGRSA
jgi:23S rRNA pseudouridine1911/1915/1917 synthase